MEFIGNYKEWITPQLMEIISTPGLGDNVQVWSEYIPLKREDRDRAFEALGKDKHMMYHAFDLEQKEFYGLGFLEPPIELNERYDWWIIKLLPGQMQPMHFDRDSVHIDDCVRYTMFLQDWQPGHIHTFGNGIFTDYKAGDMFKWSDPYRYHGAANLSYDTRYTLQISTGNFSSGY